MVEGRDRTRESPATVQPAPRAGEAGWRTVALVSEPPRGSRGASTPFVACGVGMPVRLYDVWCGSACSHRHSRTFP
jgi:hypothetical protein